MKGLAQGQPLLDSGHNTGKGILVPKKVIKCFLKNYVKFAGSTHFPELTGRDVCKGHSVTILMHINKFKWLTASQSRAGKS